MFPGGFINRGHPVEGGEGGGRRRRAPADSKKPKWTSTGRKTTLDGAVRTLYRGPGGELRVRRIRQGKAVYVKT